MPPPGWPDAVELFGVLPLVEVDGASDAVPVTCSELPAPLL